MIDHVALPLLKAQFTDIRFFVQEFRDMVSVIVPADRLVEVCLYLRDEPTLYFDQLVDLLAVDYLKYPGASHRFGVTYLLSSTRHNHRITLKVFCDPEQPTTPRLAPRDEAIMEDGDPGLRVPSVYNVWPVADWLEREQYDLMGIIFTDHPDLRRILTWNGFGSYPLRKDYPLRGVGERDDFKVAKREGA